MSEQDKELMEKLASAQHDIWAHWMNYLFSQCDELDRDDGYALVIPPEKVSRWMRQTLTDYKDLTEKEKQSDINQVMKFWHLIEGKE